MQPEELSDSLKERILELFDNHGHTLPVNFALDERYGTPAAFLEQLTLTTPTDISVLLYQLAKDFRGTIKAAVVRLRVHYRPFLRLFSYFRIASTITIS
jgi:hypothetical protein